MTNITQSTVVAELLDDNGHDGDYDLAELSAAAREILNHAATSVSRAKSAAEITDAAYFMSVVLMQFDDRDRDIVLAHFMAKARGLFGVTRNQIQCAFGRGVQQVLDRRAAAPTAEAARPAVNKASRLVTICAADEEPRNIDFVWGNGEGKQGGRLARGKHTCFAGEGGLGKSTLLIDITATITTGGLWPCNEGRSPIGNVVVLSAEDGVNDVLIPRLMAAGADRSRVKIVQGVTTNDGKARRFNLQDDLAKLEQTIREIGEVALVWIDPVSSYMGKLDSHKNTELRAALDPITEMAERTGIAFASVTHFNKGSADKGFKAVHRVMGGGAFIHAPRAAFAIMQDPDDGNRRLLLHLKNNLGPTPQGLAYLLGGRVVGIDGQGRDIYGSYVMWSPDPISKTADEVMGGDGDRQPALQDAKQFLQDELSHGDVEVTVIEAQAAKAGIAARTLRRAREDLKNEIGLTTRREGFGPGAKFWLSLPAP